MKKNRIPIRIVSSIMLASFLSTLIINPTITFSSSNSSSTVTPLYFGVMLHAEGYENEASNKTVFEKHANMIRTYASIFEANGARLTVEARPEFVQGCIRWEDNVLKELENKGHGIGVHADAGNQPGLTMKQFTQQLKDMKADIESLGVTVRHVSGVNSPLDWVKAASDAGFIAVSGVVAYSVKSLPRENVPPEYLYAYDSTNPGQAHESIPFEADEQLHPWRMESGLNWLNRSATGPAVILTGDSGKGINTLAGDDKLIDQEDIDAFIELLDEHLKYVRPGLVNEYYVAWSVGTEQDPAMVDAWLKAIKPYVDSGKVVFKTLPEMLDAYLQWEKKDYFAEGTCRPNFEPYICIQNPASQDANVKITYMLGDGTTKEQTLTVGKQSRYTVAVKDFLGEGDDASHDFSAKVDCTNGRQIIAERPMYFNYNGWTGGHNVVGATSPVTTFYFAEGTCRPNFEPYICIQNPDTRDANVKITYMLGDGTTKEQTLTVGKQSRYTVAVKDFLGEGDDASHDFSAKVDCTNVVKIICERPVYFNYQQEIDGGHNVMGFTVR